MNWAEASIILALVLVNGFFAGSELALVSARKPRLKARADRGYRSAIVALKLLENPTTLLSSVQIGITLVGILTGVYSGAVFAEDLAVHLRNIEWLVPYSEESAFAIVAIPMLWIARIAAPLRPRSPRTNCVH